MSSKSHSINLWNREDSSTKLDIEVTASSVDVAVTGSQIVKINPALYLVDGVGGDITSVSTKLHDLTSAIASGNAVSATASALVQSNLNAYATSNDLTVATLNATVVSNKAISDLNHTSDADSRVALQTALETKIQDEEDLRVADVQTLTSTISTEIANRASAISALTTSTTNSQNTLQTNIDVEKTRIDAILNGSTVDLNSFTEVVNAYSSLNTSAIAQITQLQTDLATLTATVAALTN